MKQWLAGLNERERQIVIAGAALLLLILVYLLMWEPLLNKRAQLHTSVAAQAATYQWMQQAAGEIKQLSHRPGASVTSKGSVLGTINSTAKSLLKGAVVKRVEEDRQQGVRVWIEQAAFDDLVRWLGALRQQHGIHVTSLVTERHTKPGRVNARLILQRG